MAGIVARYHRGALPCAGQEAFRGLSLSQRKDVLRLASILRLANAFDESRDGHIRRLKVKSENGFVLIAAQGYSPRNRTADAIAGARHLLEMVCRRPVIIKPMRLTGVRTVR